MKYRDLIERLFWTVVAAALTNFGSIELLGIAAWKAAALAGINGAVTFLLVVARARLAVLPDPGAGLPGLPTNGTVNIAERLGLPYDPEPSTRDRGAVSVATVCLIVLAVIAVLWVFGEVPR